jgi:hypothetical protein
MNFDLDKLKELPTEEFLKVSSLLVISYAKEKKCLNQTIENAPDGVKKIFIEALQNIRDNDLDEILRNK